MNHTFHPSIVDNSICIKCKHSELDHTNRATCEACSNSGTCDIFCGMLLCEDCLEKEHKAIAEHQSPEKQNERTAEYNKLEEIRRVDQSITTHMDFFNAATASIADLKKTIDEDPTVENKYYKLAEELYTRFEHLKLVLFEAKETQLKASNEQRAIQTYFNDLSKRLKSEEREKFKIADINYQPKPLKPAKPTAIKPKKVKFDKAELNKFAAELKVPAYNLQSIAVQRGVSISEAADILRKLLA